MCVRKIDRSAELASEMPMQTGLISSERTEIMSSKCCMQACAIDYLQKWALRFWWIFEHSWSCSLLPEYVLYSKYDHPQKWNFDENDFSKERYLWTCWSHDFPAACTLGIARNSHSTCEQSSPCRVILGSCTVPALRSVWYKNTTSCSLWILAKHTGSHACSMLETRGVSQQDVCFYAWSQAQIVIEAHSSWASVHNLSNATKCKAGAPTSQATRSISHKSEASGCKWNALL